MKTTESVLVVQDWFEDESSKNGYESIGWTFKDTEEIIGDTWNVVSVIDTDKYGHPITGIAQRMIDT